MIYFYESEDEIRIFKNRNETYYVYRRAKKRFEFMNLRVCHDLIQPYTNELNAPLADIRPLFAEESWSNWDCRIRPLLEDSKH